MILIVNSRRDLIVWTCAVHGAALALLPAAGLPAALSALAGLVLAGSFLRACRLHRALPAISRAVLDNQDCWRLRDGRSGRWYEAGQPVHAVTARAWALVILDIAPGRVPLLVTRRGVGAPAFRRLRVRLLHPCAGRAP